MTYAELVDEIQEMLENEEADFVAAIPKFVQRAEDVIYQSVQLPAARTQSSGTITSGNSTITIPSNFLAPHELIVSSGSVSSVILENKDYEIIREIYPSSGTSGTPRYYSIYNDSSIIVAPSADDTYTYTFTYYFKPTSVVTAIQNWLSINAPNALLYGSLVEAYRFMKGDPDLMAEYEKGFQIALDNLQIFAEGRNRKDTYRIPNKKVDT